MKIIVAYASAGSGHRKAAEAVYNYFKEKSRFIDIQLVDALEKTNYLFKNIYIYGYRFLINYAIWLWAALFWITSFKQLKSALIPAIDRLNARKFANFLIEEQPDIIISTHFLSSEISAYLKRRGEISSKLITVITDFGAHPIWISSGTDIYVVASSFTKKQLLDTGVREDCIEQYGIPIDPKFTNHYEKSGLCKKFGLERDKLTALVTTGTFGLGPVEKIVDLLYKDIQIMVVCANNKRLYAKLKYKNYPNVKVFGFIDNIQELMAVSDIVIAKPGGLTTSEILSMELVPIFICPIPGQETDNIKAMERCGIGKFAKRIKDVKKIVLDYKERPGELNKIKEIIKRIKKPFAARDIYNAIR